MAEEGRTSLDRQTGELRPGRRAGWARQRRSRSHRNQEYRPVNDLEIDRLRGPILRSVSRSFYLSLRVLPRPLRDPLSLAYLMARATDTIADTPEPPLDVRIEALRNLAGVIQGDTRLEALASLRDSFGPLQKNETERGLIGA